MDGIVNQDFTGGGGVGKIAIVSTFPAKGTRNIGDALIGQSVETAFQDGFGSSIHLRQVFRGESWSAAKKVLDWADHIVFACLAIRKNLASVTYPFIREILESSKPLSVLAAGSDMPVKSSVDFRSAVDRDSESVLQEIGERATLFTTRGALTQRFCAALGIEAAEFAGDVAFYRPQSYGTDFAYNKVVRRIVVSDPHRAESYLESFSLLIAGLNELFPAARIVVALHGVNSIIEALCQELGVRFVRIYESPNTGLSVYDDCDLHVGYRIHGHVSALSRRVYSYLLEQDGRGADYGLTLSRKVSVPHFLQVTQGQNGGRSLAGSIASPQQLLGLIEHDSIAKFEKFTGWGPEIEGYSRATESYIAKIVESL